MIVPVVTAAQSGARDRAAIDAGIPSRALMQRAGAAAATIIAQRWPRRLAGGVAVYAGGGNNGGDAWVVAAALAAAGVRVRVHEVQPARTDDARAECEHARRVLDGGLPDGTEAIVVDGLLGTGASGAPRGAVAEAIAGIAEARARGARIVALDVPSGVDATTGADEGAVTADLTIAFGTMKRGLLAARGRTGTLLVADIGLGAHALPDDDPAPLLVDAAWVRARVAAFRARAHKGTRGRLAIVGGARGMAGAAVLAARAALKAGAGLVKVVVAPESVAAVQGAVPEAIAGAWPADDDAARREIGEWAHGVLVGPGLGASARALVERVLLATRDGMLPTVLDADALNAFAGDAVALGGLLDGRPALLTPHPGELARLAGSTAEGVDRERYDVVGPLAARTGAAVLLKGVPTVLGDATGARWVSAAGSPVLATGGSGDLLAGLAATLVMQRREALETGACAAWLHGRAAELAGAAGARGATLDDVLAALPTAWREPVRRPLPPVLAMLPEVGDA